MLNPIAARQADSLKEVQRAVFCEHYDKCLDFAISQGWEGFTCICCGLFAPPKRTLDKWLEANTISCSLGRLTPEQCRINRGRKGLRECVNYCDKSPEAKLRRMGIVTPGACEKCTDWGKLNADFRRRKRILEGGKEKMGRSRRGCRGLQAN